MASVGACDIDKFRDAIRTAGLEPPDVIVPDGKLHRFSSNGKRGDDAGWYVFHGDDIAAGAFGDWRTGIDKKWRSGVGRELTAAEKAARRSQVEAVRRERKAEENMRRTEAHDKAAAIWKAARPAPDVHPYLLRKRVKPYGIRVNGESLIVPMRDHRGELSSLQFITRDGGKKFLPGGRVVGCYCSLGRPLPWQPLCIVEGYATGATVHEATGFAVAIAFNAGNLEAVASVLRDKYPALQLVVCADDDYETDGNPGTAKARAAARAAHGLIALPDFGQTRRNGATDFNDLARACGLDAVRHAIAMRRTWNL